MHMAVANRRHAPNVYCPFAGLTRGNGVVLGFTRSAAAASTICFADSLRLFMIAALE